MGVPPSSLGREGVTLTIPQNDTMGMISTEQNENVLRPPRERPCGGGGKLLNGGMGASAPILTSKVFTRAIFPELWTPGPVRVSGKKDEGMDSF